MGKRSKIPVSKTHPHLMEEWDFDKNEIRPEEITYGSNKKVWWVCSKEKCRHKWLACASGRTGTRKRGCPACSGNVVTCKNVLSSRLVGKLYEEWDKEKNKSIDIESLVLGTQVKAWWNCSVCGYAWKTAIRNRTVLGTGCPVCSGRVVTSDNSLAALHQGIARDWDFDKNFLLTPKDVTIGCNKRVWWRCRKCGYEWATAVYNRSGKYKKGCPKCAVGSVSKVSQKWLDSLNIPRKYREYKIKDLGFRVDGFDPKTNTAYEFLGDYWHGNPKIFSPEKINPTNKKSFGQLHQETMERIDILKENRYKVVYVWEDDFKKQKSIVKR